MGVTMSREIKGLGRQIRVLRARAGLTRAELGALLGTSPVVVSLWESVYHRPNKRLMQKLNRAMHLGVRGDAAS